MKFYPNAQSRLVALREAVKFLKQPIQADGFPFKKSWAILELARGVAASGHEVGAFRVYWVRGGTVCECASARRSPTSISI